MFYYISNSNQAAYNQATEEYFLKNFEENFYMLYRNKAAVIIGKHQNALAEINLDKCEDEGIEIVRRLSGGGTVFHDDGNLNYCFISNGTKGELINFKKYSQPVIDVLQSLNVDAKFEGKSDLTIAGMKFSGNASHIYRSKVLQHGTMLFSSDLNRLNSLLKVNPLKFTDRGVRSIRSRVTNICDHLSSPLSIEELQTKIVDHLQETFPGIKAYELKEADREAILKLMEEKYLKWEWNFGYSPKYKIERLLSFANGNILEVELDIEKGRIVRAEILGNCIKKESIAKLEEKLINMPHHKETISSELKTLDMDTYFNNLSLNELIKAIF
ncbi:lipoate--protein ligase [Ancylomarina sp. 16SWW S1-10-2]|uniref:lipoate--protein ligase n=1 Tax=Ancylomarina sp. 16SWW S1-10-2 TaxID=2499681 RepID=UPI0012ADBD3A|nr:lipoate--protein ligase [Ancylomarina sp. 16SWW S1-10-2]MRT93838.1 lipoate--protein ligase [Ancylomarina sp. 16SWW S1-10-2]